MKKAVLPRNKKLKVMPAHLRNNAAQEENKLWYEFPGEYPIRFNRQRLVGDHIAYFYCARAKLVIEPEGSQHYEEAAMDAVTKRPRVGGCAKEEGINHDKKQKCRYYH